MTTSLRAKVRQSVVVALFAGASFALPHTAAPAAAQTCVGDCGGNGSVSVGELIIGVNIALGLRDISDCSSFDVNGDGSVSIGELIQAVRVALGQTECMAGPTATMAPPTPTATPGCPLTAGSYTLTQVEGGTLAVGTISDFAFPAGGTIKMDVSDGDADCVHDVIVPADGGLDTPIFCIQALSFSVDVSQAGCGVGRIDSNGGSDFTIAEQGDSSDASPTCNIPGCNPGVDSSVRVDITVGDGTPDSCGSGTGNALVAIPVFTTTWSEAAGCPAPDGEYNPGVDTLIVQFPQILDFTTDTNTATWTDIDGDGCYLAGVGLESTSASGVCLDIGAATVTTAAAGTIGSSGSPLFDISFRTRLPNSISGPEEPLGAVCDPAPVIDFGGTATRCIE